jgi:hypothetical protein
VGSPVWTPKDSTIYTTGNVGVGTEVAQKPLDVAEAGGIRISQTAEASSDNEIYFADNGQIRSLDDSHRIIFNRAGNDLELRENGTITFSAGATQGQRTALMQITSSTNVPFSPAISGTVAIACSGGVMGNWGVVGNISTGGNVNVAGNISIGNGTVLSGSRGNLGIGTASPTQLVDINGAMALRGPLSTFDGATQRALIQYESNGLIVRDGAAGSDQWWMYFAPGQVIRFLGGTQNTADARFIITNGNVGIGTANPQYRLDVSGDIGVSGDVFLTGADCAEEFDAGGTEPPGPGTVVVIDEAGALRESRSAYDKRVAGVVSGGGEFRHGLILDKRSTEEPRVPVALVGKVYCKADAQYSPIEVGDLLTTSPTEGHAMKAADPLKAFGSVIGKALRSLKEGQGLIPILVALQ